MTFWKKSPPPPWQDRLERARRLIAEHSDDPSTSARVDEVERSLVDSLDDQSKLRSAIESLRPDQAAAELKQALRERPTPTTPDTPLIRTLRERHESINDLQNRLERLEAQQEATLADLDTLAAHLVEASLGDLTRPLESEVDRLRVDAELLKAAHDEIAHL